MEETTITNKKIEGVDKPVSSIFFGTASYPFAKGEDESEIMDPFAMKGYACPENFERLRRCEILAEEKNVEVPQIAMAWIFSQPLHTFAIVSTSRPERMQENIQANDIYRKQKK